MFAMEGNNETVCFVCNVSSTDKCNLNGRKFYHYLQYAEEIQEQLRLNTVPVLQNPGSMYICSFHFQPKIEHEFIQCFVCGAKKTDFPDQQFFPFAAKKKYLKLNGVLLTPSSTSTFICGVHFKTKVGEDPSSTMNFNNCGIESLTRALKDFEEKKINRSQSRVRCCVASCPRTQSQPRTTIDCFKCYLFPSSEQRAASWWEALGRAPIKTKRNSVICKKHFEPRFITSDGCLTANAIPTLYLHSATSKFGCSSVAPVVENAEPILIEESDSESDDVIEIDMETEDVQDFEKDIQEEPGEAEKGESEAPEESPLGLNNIEDVMKHMQPLFDLALLSENYQAVGLLNKLEDIFKNEIKFN
ncbi:hypothetical protein ACFFRR_010354 [Megaselia abdita]